MRALVILATAAASLALAGSAAADSMLYIRGGGYGHGIGMSQYGAYGYALQGKDYRFILAHYYQGTTLGTTDPNRIVRVLLGSGSAGFSGATQAAGGSAGLSGAAPAGSGPAQSGSAQLNPQLTYHVRALANGALALVDPSGKQLGPFQAPLTVTGPDPLDVAGLGLYRGALEYRPGLAGAVYTVNLVGLDDYVRGVVAAEMPASWAPEALNVQAVAARTYAITTTGSGSFFDVYPDTRSQMYRGVSAETPATDAAVAATRGQIVTYGGVPAVTYFSASSGGYTENVEDAWPAAAPEPWLHGVPDPYDGAGGNPYYRWGRDMRLATAGARLGGLVKGKLIGIRVTQHGVSPRIMLADVVGTGGRTSVTGDQLQRAFGLPSSYAAFTTISTVAALKLTNGTLRPVRRSERAVVALVKRLHGLLATGVPALRGEVFPGSPGAIVTVQVRDGGGWHQSLRVRLDRAGAYVVRLPAPGTYRVVYRGLNGPAVVAP